MNNICDSTWRQVLYYFSSKSSPRRHIWFYLSSRTIAKQNFITLLKACGNIDDHRHNCSALQYDEKNIFFLFIYLKCRKTWKETETTQISHPLFHSPKVCNSKGWTSLETRIQFRSPTRVERSQVLELSITCLLGIHQLKAGIRRDLHSGPPT